MSLKITKRVVSDITILDLEGRITLGEAAGLLRDTVRDLLGAGTKNILLNFGDVHYIDSSGLGELVSSFTTVYNAGGRLKLVNLRKKLRDLLIINKMATVFEIFDDEQAAVPTFITPTGHFRCPVCGGRVWLPAIGSNYIGPEYCGRCESKIALAVPGDASEALVETIRIRSYSDEYVEVTAGPPYRVRMVGRMNLFSSSALKKGWRAIPTPKRVLFDLREVTDVEAAGRDALLSLLADAGKDPRIAVLLEELRPKQRSGFPHGPPFFNDEASALRALGDVSDTPGLVVRVEEG